MGKSCFHVHWVLGRIQFPEVVGLQFLLPFLLSLESCSQLLEAFVLSLHVPFSILKASNGALSPSDALNLSVFPFCYQPKFPAFIGLRDYIKPAWIISLLIYHGSDIPSIYQGVNYTKGRATVGEDRVIHGVLPATTIKSNS